MNNKLNNQSYFIKRLRDSGYVVNRLDFEYSYRDPRAWTVIIDPGNSSVFCTCYINANKDDIRESNIGDNYFELYDGGQFLPQKFKLNTNSVEVIMSFLNQYGIIGKSSNYDKK
jgi:hypothetical protein